MPCFQLGPWLINQNANLPSTSSCTVTVKTYLYFFPIFYSTTHCLPTTPQLLSESIQASAHSHTPGVHALYHFLALTEISKVAQLCLTLCDSMDCSLPSSSVHGIFQAEYWSGLPFPSPRDLPNPGIKPGSPALQADAVPSEPPEKP